VENRAEVQKLLTVINAYTKTGQEMLNNFGHIKEYDNYTTHTLIQILERLTYNSISVSLILEQYLKAGNEHYEYSIGLLFRNCSSDIITLLYINYLGADVGLTEEQLEDRIKALLGKEIKRTLNAFDKVVEKDELVQYKKMLVSVYPDFFKLDNKGDLVECYTWDKSLKEEFTTTGMLEKVKKYLSQFLFLKELWKRYSQYEHLGGLTYDLQRNIPFEKKIIEMRFSAFNIIRAMWYVATNINNSQFKKDDHIKKLDSVMQLYHDLYAFK